MENLTTFGAYYQAPSTRIGRNGKKAVVQRSVGAWTAAIEGHRKDAHQGKRAEGCAACAELERKHAAAIAQEGRR